MTMNTFFEKKDVILVCRARKSTYVISVLKNNIYYCGKLQCVKNCGRVALERAPMPTHGTCAPCTVCRSAAYKQVLEIRK